MNEVLVVGAGPVGLTMAAELARHGIKCRIIDKNPEHAADSRAAGIHARTMEVFEDMGIVDFPLKHGVKVVAINLYSHSKHLIHTVFKNLDSRYNYILDMPQSLTEPMLIEHLKSFGIEVERGIELTHIEQNNDAVAVALNDKPESFSYVIGCDGAGSTCRNLLKIPFPGEEYSSSWAVFDSKLKWPYDSQELHLFLHEKGLSAFFPLPEGRMRVTCELLVGEAKKLAHVTYSDVLTILKERVSEEIELIDPKDLSPFILHHRQVEQYCKGRVFLAGDAAHIHSPAGGQGMNTGIQDAYNLAWKLALVLKKKSPESLLDTYHEERHPIGKWVLDTTDHMMQLVETKNAFFSSIRDAFLSVASHVDALKTMMPKRFSQLYLQYDKSSIVAQNCKEHPPEVIHSGDRAPDHLLKSLSTQKEIRLFELLQGPHHTLLLFTGKMPSGEDLELLREFYTFTHSGYDPLIRPYLLIRNGEDEVACPNPKSCLIDQEPSLHTHYGVEKATAMLIRPDGYVGFINEPPSIEAFKAYLSKIFSRNSSS